MAGLVPAIPIIGHCAILIEIAGTSPAMTPRVLLLLQQVDAEFRQRHCCNGGAGKSRAAKCREINKEPPSSVA
jgi:hypothetical protein